MKEISQNTTLEYRQTRTTSHGFVLAAVPTSPVSLSTVLRESDASPTPPPIIKWQKANLYIHALLFKNLRLHGMTDSTVASYIWWQPASQAIKISSFWYGGCRKGVEVLAVSIYIIIMSTRIHTTEQSTRHETRHTLQYGTRTVHIFL
jgi:hypothetical protein